MRGFQELLLLAVNRARRTTSMGLFISMVSVVFPFWGFPLLSLAVGVKVKGLGDGRRRGNQKVTFFSLMRFGFVYYQADV